MATELSRQSVPTLEQYGMELQTTAVSKSFGTIRLANPFQTMNFVEAQQ
jgi:hypothetical protein